MEKGRLLGWSLSCTRFKPRRKTVPGLVPGRGQSEPHGPCAGLPGWPAPRLCGFLAGHIPVNLEHSCIGRGPCRDSHSTSKGLPQDGAGGSDNPKSPAHCWGGQQPELRAESACPRRELWTLPLRWFPARSPRGSPPLEEQLVPWGRRGLSPGLGPLSPGPSASQVSPCSRTCPLGGHIASLLVPGDPAT